MNGREGLLGLNSLFSCITRVTCTTTSTCNSYGLPMLNRINCRIKCTRLIVQVLLGHQVSITFQNQLSKFFQIISLSKGSMLRLLRHFTFSPNRAVSRERYSSSNSSSSSNNSIIRNMKWQQSCTCLLSLVHSSQPHFCAKQFFFQHFVLFRFSAFGWSKSSWHRIGIASLAEYVVICFHGVLPTPFPSHSHSLYYQSSYSE